MTSHTKIRKILSGFLNLCQNFIEFSSRHRRKFLVTAIICAIILVASLVYHPKRVFEISPENIAKINTTHGVGYVAQLNLSVDFPWEIEEKTFKFIESGKKLKNYSGIANPDHVTEMGNGAFGVAQRKSLRKELGWKKSDGEIVFTSSDGSDPRFSSQKYVLISNIKLNSALINFLAIYCILVFFIANYIWSHKISNESFLFSAIGIGIIYNIYFYFLHMNNDNLAGKFSGLFMLDLANGLFEPQSNWLAESMLLPILTLLVGANTTQEMLTIFCGFLYVILLPLFAIYIYNWYNKSSPLGIKNAKNRVSFIAIFFAIILTFPYFKVSMIYPDVSDSLTIMFLVLAVFAWSPLTIFTASFLAGLSHFSLAIIAIFLVSMLIYCSKQRYLVANWLQTATALLGLAVAKIILLVWFYVFDYHIAASRWEIGLKFIFDRTASYHFSDFNAFLMTPGLTFLIMYGVIVSYFVIIRRYLFALALLFAIMISYFALWATWDGLRVFAVAISGAYVFALREFVESLSLKFPLWWNNNMKTRINSYRNTLPN